MCILCYVPVTARLQRSVYMQRYTVDIHRQGNTAMRCLRSFHAMLAVTAGDREG